jgi:hypothetical protein
MQAASKNKNASKKKKKQTESGQKIPKHKAKKVPKHLRDQHYIKAGRVKELPELKALRQDYLDKRKLRANTRAIV